jgi:hypothetical protein
MPGAEDSGPAPARDPRSTFLLLSDFERLEEWSRLVRVLFDGQTPLLVGSALRTVEYRDVDLRLILGDGLFDRYWANRVKVRLANRAVSIWGQEETGLRIDFQIQRRTEAEAAYPDGLRVPMGIRDWALIPTSGTPR